MMRVGAACTSRHATTTAHAEESSMIPPLPASPLLTSPFLFVSSLITSSVRFMPRMASTFLCGGCSVSTGVDGVASCLAYGGRAS